MGDCGRDANDHCVGSTVFEECLRCVKSAFDVDFERAPPVVYWCLSRRCGLIEIASVGNKDVDLAEAFVDGGKGGVDGGLVGDIASDGEDVGAFDGGFNEGFCALEGFLCAAYYGDAGGACFGEGTGD